MEEQQQQPQDGLQRNQDVVFTKRIRAGRRTYFFDVRATRGNDYYLTITESKKRPDDTYVKHKIFVYKEDFNKFVAGLDEAVAKIKTELMPDFNFEQFDRPERTYEERQQYNQNQPQSNYNNDGNDNAPIAENGNANDQNIATNNDNNANYNRSEPTNEPTNDEDLKW